jgi:hypothetical protein
MKFKRKISLTKVSTSESSLSPSSSSVGEGVNNAVAFAGEVALGFVRLRSAWPVGKFKCGMSKSFLLYI